MASPSMPPQSIETSSIGGMLYVIDTWNDFFDDGGKLYDPTAGPIRFLGEQALHLVLRTVSRSTSARLVGTAWTEFAHGQPTDFEVSRPIGFPQSDGQGRLILCSSISLGVSPILSADGASATIRYRLKQRVTRRKPLLDTEFDARKPTGPHETAVAEGERTLPVGATLVWVIPRDGDRITAVLLHIASVRRDR